MSVLPHAVAWRRLDLTGAEFAAYDDRHGLAARGVATAGGRVPYACRYELFTDKAWETARFEATAEGAGWVRTVKLERAAGRWRVTTAEQGDLNTVDRTAPFPGSEDPARLTDALDVDLAASPLTNTLPVRRLNLRGAPPGSRHEITAAWVLLPSLAVVPSTQVYEVIDANHVRYSSGKFTAVLALDDAGFVVTYEHLAER